MKRDTGEMKDLEGIAYDQPLVPPVRRPYPSDIPQDEQKPPRKIPEAYSKLLKNKNLSGDKFVHSNFNPVYSDDDDYMSEEDYEQPRWVADSEQQTLLACPDLSQEQKQFMIMWNAFIRETFPPGTVILEHWSKDVCMDFVVYAHKRRMFTSSIRRHLGIHMLLLLKDHRLSSLDVLTVCHLADTLLGHRGSVLVCEKAMKPYIAVQKARIDKHDKEVLLRRDRKEQNKGGKKK
ncbi:VEFS-Box of polycomb protein [Carpediemonas membranifera]|uniref:VEFS-Box of polycomb protein n=1 Tax=Carpediemonas membranifera TaxID=201153 RepID=A0A8J6AU27_9EUKA|nr:VEFS-Box of polycomb protein [Carpediemonas membranifera]|eukprot:KAG9392465.1 VEFS-Box of polycomb protein [Carpediemonas membranifera]